MDKISDAVQCPSTILASRANEDEAHLLQGADDQPEPWRPIHNSSQWDASSYGERSYIPMSSAGVSNTSDQETYERYQYDSEEEPPAYDGHHDYIPGQTDDDELLIPPAEECRRPRWGMDTNPYQTPRFYDEPMLDVNSGYPRQPTTGVSSTVSNNVVIVQPGHSVGNIYTPAHVTDYTCLSVFVIVCCCLPLGIRALIKARNAKSLLLLGRRQEALESANTSRNLNIAGMIIGPILTTVIVLLKIYVFHSYRRYQ